MLVGIHGSYTEMIKDSHKSHVALALNVIQQCGKVDKNGKVSYSATHEYKKASLILKTLVNSKSVTQSESTSCLARALNAYVLDGYPGIDHFRKLVAAETGRINRSAKQPFEVLRSCYTDISIELRSRKLFGTLIRSGRIFKIEDTVKGLNLSRHVLKAIDSRSAIKTLAEETQYLPSFHEGNVFFAVRVLGSDVLNAKEKAEFALDRYLALLNFVAGFGRGATWDINPLQPQAVVVPSAYTSVHDNQGKLVDNAIYYDPQLSLVRPSGKHVNIDRAKRLDKQMDFVIDRINKHFDPPMLWEAINLLGSAYSGTDDNHIFLKCWMVLERLMYFGTAESHQDMIKRMRFILTDEIEGIEIGVLESLRMTRNHVAHEGLDISGEHRFFLDTPSSTLVNFVNRLLHFHLHIPKAISSKDDFLRFTRLPSDSVTLKSNRALISAMLHITMLKGA